MTTFEVIEAKPWHVGTVAHRIRCELGREVGRAGYDVHRSLRYAARASMVCLAWKIDGRIEAIGGVAAPLAASDGHVWLALTDRAVQFPVAMVREARRQLARVSGTRRTLITSVLEGDRPARRFIEALGFRQFGKPEEIGETRMILMEYRVMQDKN